MQKEKLGKPNKRQREADRQAEMEKERMRIEAGREARQHEFA